MASNFWESPHALELVPRASVLSAHARERALGLGDGDIEAYKAFIVEYMTEVARHSSGALRQRVVASAAVFARRHLLRRGLAALAPLPLALACLFLAAKVEESHVSARYLLRAAERAGAAEGRFSSRGAGGAAAAEEEEEEEEEQGAKKKGGGGNAGISLVASSSAAFQRDGRNSRPSASAAAATFPVKRPTAAGAAAAAAPSLPSSTNDPASSPALLPLPSLRQLLEAEAELVFSLGARGLLLWSPYPDALEAAAAIEEERERRRKAREEEEAARSSSSNSLGPARGRKRKSSGEGQQLPPPPPPRLGARAWAAVSVSLGRTDACLWAPPHVVGFAAAAVAAAAADEAERLADEEEEEARRDGEEEEEAAAAAGAGGEATGASCAPSFSSSSSSSSSFSAAATRWFSSLDVDLDSIAEVAAELCYAAGVERAAGKAGTGGAGDARRRRTGDGGGGGGSAHQRADAALRVFEFLRSG